MNILDRTQEIRIKTKKFGRYRFVSEKSKVSYEWLCKFAVGKITNPTVENIHKLEQFFFIKGTEELNKDYLAWWLENKILLEIQEEDNQTKIGRRFEDLNIKDRRKKVSVQPGNP
jgi:hypothetical protein